MNKFFGRIPKPLIPVQFRVGGTNSEPRWNWPPRRRYQAGSINLLLISTLALAQNQTQQGQTAQHDGAGLGNDGQDQASVTKA